MRHFIILYIFSIKAFANVVCPEFDTALKLSFKRMESHKEERKAFELNSKEVLDYKRRFSKELDLGEDANRNFMSLISKKQKNADENAIYFDLENSVQKKMNDQIFKDKGMVDAINNSYMEKFVNNVTSDPLLSKRLNGKYKDYKSLRLSLDGKDSKDKEAILKRLDEIYKKTSEDFAIEVEQLNLRTIIGPRTDETIDVRQWFLSGSGDTPIEANMAARSARDVKATGTKSVLNFNNTIDKIHGDIEEVEKIRMSFSANKRLLENNVVEELENGKLIPSKEMISILRKVRPSDFTNLSDYVAKIKDKTKKMFSVDLSEEEIIAFSDYFRKVDSLSPPLFTRERTIIDLSLANKGIVSVDFTGVGVDNAYSQMKALAKLDYSLSNNKKTFVSEAFENIQKEVDSVTDMMNKSKRYFSTSLSKVAEDDSRPLFSGDDGIFMPSKKEWHEKEKMNLLLNLSKFEDPSKFRVTFVKNHYTDGKILDTSERSKRIVRAESLEKDVRDKVTGISKISSSKSKNLIIAVDFSPEFIGGKFKLMVNGKGLSSQDKKIIEEAYESSLDQKMNEISTGIIWSE